MRVLCYAPSVDNRQRQALLEVNPDLRYTKSPSGMAYSLYIIEIKIRVMMKGLLQLYMDTTRAVYLIGRWNSSSSCFNTPAAV